MKNASAVCVDAGLVVRRVLFPQDVAVQAKWEEWDQDARAIIAPMLLRYEVTNAFYQYEKAGTLSVYATQRALSAALALPIRLYRDTPLSTEALIIASRYALPATYDAHYLALAQRSDVEFWTTDRRLFNTVSTVLPWVRLVLP